MERLRRILLSALGGPFFERSSIALSVLACVVLLAGIPASVGLRLAPSFGVLPAALPADSAHAVLEVTVRDLAGAAVQGATVRVFSGPRRVYAAVATSRTDEAGRVLLAGLPQGPGWVLVEGTGLARSSRAVVLGDDVRVGFSLEPRAHLTVRVRAEDGQPIAGATVLVLGADVLPFGGLSDGDGAVRFDRLGKAPWKVRVLGRGYDAVERSDVVADTEIVLRRAGVLEVTVTDARSAKIAGATVLVAGPSLWPARSVETDANGRARLSGLARGAYDLKALKGALVSAIEVGVPVGQGEARAVTLMLVPGRMIPFVVTDGEGDHPLVVPDADVVLVENGVSSFPIQGRTDRFGKVTLGPVGPGMVVAKATADGFVTRSTVDVPEVVSGDVRIPLLRGAALAGEVVDVEGHPVAGAAVEVIGTDEDGMPVALTPGTLEFQRQHFAWALEGPSPLLPAGELGVMVGPIPNIPGEGDTGVLVERRMPPDVAFAAPWVTSGDGTFHAGSLPPGRLAVIVRHPSYVETTSDMVRIASGGTGHVRVVLRPGGALAGAVVDGVGMPVAGVRVEVTAARGTLVRSAVTADDGTFSFPTLPSEVFVTLARPGDPTRPVLRQKLDVPDGGRSEVKLVLPEPLDPVEVEAEDESGRPVPAAQVTALSLDPERPLRSTEFTDLAGRASIGDAASLPLRIVVEVPGFSHWSRQFDETPARIVASLVASVLVEGRVTSVRGRSDVTGATVELLADGRRQVAVTDALGKYRFTDVTPGRAHLAVTHPDFAPSELDVRIESTGRADRAFDVDPIDLEEPGTVEGRVVDARGEPVAGARVGVGTVAAFLPALGAVLATTSGQDGAFTLARVRPGAVTVEAFLAGSGRGRVTGIDVSAGRTASGVTIQLEPAADDTDVGASGGVAVTLVDHGGGAAVVQVARGSEAEHAGLLAGDVIVSVDRASAGNAKEARRKLAGPEGSDVVIGVLREGQRVALRIRREPVRQ